MGSTPQLVMKPRAEKVDGRRRRRFLLSLPSFPARTSLVLREDGVSTNMVWRISTDPGDRPAVRDLLSEIELLIPLTVDGNAFKTTFPGGGAGYEKGREPILTAGERSSRWFRVQPIGYVHRPDAPEPDPAAFYDPRVETALDILPRWGDALTGIEEYAHLFVIVWLDHALVARARLAERAGGARWTAGRGPVRYPLPASGQIHSA